MSITRPTQAARYIKQPDGTLELVEATITPSDPDWERLINSKESKGRARIKVNTGQTPTADDEGNPKK